MLSGPDGLFVEKHQVFAGLLRQKKNPNIRDRRSKEDGGATYSIGE